jgi:hypothetical protein
MRRILRLTVIAAFFLSFLLQLRSAEPTPALPAGDPVTTLTLPNGLQVKDVSVAVSKALVALEWENLGWDGDVTTATSKQSRVVVKVFALASAANVKFYATYTQDGSVSDEKCKQIALRQFRTLEKNVAEKLNLYFRKAKGDSTVDQATAD